MGPYRCAFMTLIGPQNFNYIQYREGRFLVENNISGSVVLCSVIRNRWALRIAAFGLLVSRACEHESGWNF